MNFALIGRDVYYYIVVEKTIPILFPYLDPEQELIYNHEFSYMSWIINNNCISSWANILDTLCVE